ncbi:MAG: ribbon-helix-helix domain-containing protein [Micrococcales bacterium]|nr:ribbon-helix-helix domain-containing protein [Micrococcales bacterium]
MARVTIHLDEETHALLEQAARADGVPPDRWVAQLIRQRTGRPGGAAARPGWPEGWKSLIGSVPDFPLRSDPPQAGSSAVMR